MARLRRHDACKDKPMDRNDDKGSFWASTAAVLALMLVVSVLYLPLFL